MIPAEVADAAADADWHAAVASGAVDIAHEAFNVRKMRVCKMERVLNPGPGTAASRVNSHRGRVRGGRGQLRRLRAAGAPAVVAVGNGLAGAQPKAVHVVAAHGS